METNGRVLMVRLLIKQRCEINIADNHGITPVQLASGLEFNDITEVLLAAGSQIQPTKTYAERFAKVAENQSSHHSR